MKPSLLLCITLLASVMFAAHKTEAWPWQRWFSDENSISTIPVTDDDNTEINLELEATHYINTQFNPEQESIVGTLETITSTTGESPSFWSNLYQILRGAFSDSTPSNDTSSSSVVLTSEAMQTTDPEISTTEIQDGHIFENFFASLSNNLVNIYDGLSSRWGNTTLDSMSDTPQSYTDYFTNEVDALLQNYTLPITDEQDLNNMKSSIVDALVSAWNRSLEIGKIPVVSPTEIQAKILETFKGAHITASNDTAITTPNKDPTSSSKYPLGDPDQIQNKFLEILKKVDQSPDGTMGASSNPSYKGGGFKKTGVETNRPSRLGWF